MKLVGSGTWENILCILHNEDIWSYHNQALEKKRPGCQGANEDSWEPSEGPAVADNTGTGIDLWTDVHLGIYEHPSCKAGEAAPCWTGTRDGRKLLSWIWSSGIPTLIKDGADKGNEILRAK